MTSDAQTAANARSAVAAESPGAGPLEGRFLAVRRATEALCEPLTAEDCAAQSMEDASPAKWHLAHTTWFFETLVLERERPDYRAFRPEFRVLFNSYYNSIGDQHPRPRRGLLSRPPLEEVMRYRRHVDVDTLDLLERRRADDPVRRIVDLGLHHEQQHQELILTDVKHLLSCNPLKPAYRDAAEPPPGPDPGPIRWHRFEEGLREIGHGGDGFAFDNESPRHRVFVEAYELASRPVTNGEFLAFVEAGGYETPEPWLSDGWETVQRDGWRAPLYWERRDGGWFQFTLAGLRPLRPQDPVCHVSYFEADAFARWAGVRLPTEAEWECACEGVPPGGNFADRGLLQPAASAPAAERPGQMLGDVWEWTCSPYVPYPGFRPLAGSLAEYNGKFMCNQMALRGGSCATPAAHIRPTYRNFFYPHQRWQFSGIRLARDSR